MMKAVKCKDPTTEVMLMKELWSRGLRYRNNNLKEPLNKSLSATMNQFRDENIRALCVQMAKNCSFNALNSSYCLLQRLFTLKMAHLSHHFHQAFFCFGIHQQICARKQHIQLVQILRNATITHLCKAKSIFDNMENMLYL